MPIMDKSNVGATTLALFLGAGLLSATMLASTLSYSSNAYAQSQNYSPFKGNVSGAIVSEQGEKANVGANMSSSGSYKPSYPKERADERNPFTVHTEKHLYKPGEKVSIEGSIWSSLIDDIGGDVTAVILNVTDNKGNVTLGEVEASVEEDGTFSSTFELPDDAELGSYSINVMIVVEANILDTLSANVKSKLATSARFEVVSPNAFAVKAEGRDFEVVVASNSTVDNFEFSQAEKKVSFRVEGETGTKGAAQVTLPKELLSGEMVVAIDGRVFAEDSNDVIVASDTETEMTLEINYPHSEHTIEITGTNVVPEFPIALIIMAASIASAIAAANIVMRKRNSFV